MEQSWGWTSITSQGHEQSVDSGSGTDAFSLINANPELSENSYLDLDATSNMAVPLRSNQPSSENLPPIRSAVVDWVQDQSQHDQPSNGATGLQRAPVDETPPPVSQAKQARAKTDGNAARQEGRQPAKKVYDIATLLRLKETQSAVPVMLRVKPEAIAGECYDPTASQASMRQADNLFQRTSSSIWELQRRVEYQHALKAFPTSQTSLTGSQRDKIT